MTIVAAAAVLSFVALKAAALTDGRLKIYFLDVGQGDAIFIESPTGNQILIDGGPDSKVINELSQIMPVGDRSIDLVVLTHPDADHVNGLVNVLERYDVAGILENPISHSGSGYAEWNRLKAEAEISNARSGQMIDLGGGAAILVIYPYVGSLPKRQANNNSIVAKLIYGEYSVLLPGDIEALVEKELAVRSPEIDSDFLKIPHHGSKTSTSEEFLNAATPETAFISVGADNRYGHPHPTVLDRLDKRGIKYYRTDTDGRIKLILDGVNQPKIQSEED